MLKVTDDVNAQLHGYDGMQKERNITIGDLKRAIQCLFHAVTRDDCCEVWSWLARSQASQAHVWRKGRINYLFIRVYRKRRINYLFIHIGVTAVRGGTWPFILRGVRLSRRLIISIEQTSIYVSTFPNALTFNKAQNHDISIHFSTNSIVDLCHTPP